MVKVKCSLTCANATLQFYNSSNHLTSVRVPNTDSPGQGFNSTENTQNGLQGKGVAGGGGGYAENTEWRPQEHRSHRASWRRTGCRASRGENCSQGIPYLPPRIPKRKLPAHQSLDIFWARKKTDILGHCSRTLCF